MLDAIFSPKVRKKSRRNKAVRETAPPETLSKPPPPLDLDVAPPSTRRDARDSQPDSLGPPRISLIAAEPETARPKSEPPPPLRTSGPALTPPSPPASAPLRAAPAINPATPLRTPVATSTDRDLAPPPASGNGDSHGDS
jgi:hypothetical protein